MQGWGVEQADLPTFRRDNCAKCGIYAQASIKVVVQWKSVGVAENGCGTNDETAGIRVLYGSWEVQMLWGGALRGLCMAHDST